MQITDTTPGKGYITVEMTEAELDAYRAAEAHEATLAEECGGCDNGECCGMCTCC